MTLVNPLLAGTPAIPAIPVAMPTVAPVAEPEVYAAPVEAPPMAGTPGTASLYASVKLVTRAVIDLPWGFISERYDYAFISNAGEIILTCNPPVLMLGATPDLDSWKLSANTKSGDYIVLGRMSDSSYWRESLTLRPCEEDDDTEEVDEVEPFQKEPVQLQEPVEPVSVAIITPEQWRNMTKTQKKKHRQKMAVQGLDVYGVKLQHKQI